MNRRPVGSSVETSGEGVWALSCSLLANFAPSGEPTPSRLLTISSSGAEEICLSSQTHAQLLRRVKNIGRRTIRWLVSLRSSVAPTVRPTLVFLHSRFIRRYTNALVPPVISFGGFSLKLTLTEARRRARTVCCRPACLRRPSRECACPVPPPPAPPCPPPAAAPLHRVESRALRLPRLGFHLIHRHPRPCAAAVACRRPQGGTQGSQASPQPYLAVHHFVVVSTSKSTLFLPP
jgi:hypothetical protein